MPHSITTLTEYVETEIIGKNSQKMENRSRDYDLYDIPEGNGMV